MYRLIKDGKVFAITENLTFIRQSNNGVYVICAEEKAQGIAHKNVPYNLLGREPMAGLETVIAVEVDGGECIHNGDVNQTDADALIVDHEYRITLIELGV